MANPNRGGTCIIIRNQLFPQVTDKDLSKPDQVWLQLKCFLGTLFGFVYIPPLDSNYFNKRAFIAIQEILKADESVMDYVIVGDINALLVRNCKNFQGECLSL